LLVPTLIIAPVAIAVLCLCGTGQAQNVSQSENTTNLRFKGTEAIAQFHDATTDVFIDLFEDISGGNGGGNVDETFLFYQVTVLDPNNGRTRYTVETGSGDIPPTDAQITRSSAHVSTSNSASGYVTQRCVVDTVANTSTCTTGTQGTVTIDWHRDGMETTFISGQSTTTSPSFTVHTGGSFSTNSAQASGSFPFGFPFSNYSGSLIDSSSSFITHDFTRNF